MFIFLLIINSLIPLMMITFGFLWKKNPPSSINWAYGYRTSMSMKNAETWKFAHMHNAKIWRWCGSIWLVVSIILMLLFKDHYEKITIWVNYIGLGIILLSLIPTEIALRRKFDKNGDVRNKP